MNVGRVVGSLVSTIKHPAYDRTKLLLVQPLDMDGNDSGATMVVVDAIGAGSGELVLVCKDGSATRQVLGLEQPPIRSLVIGIIDEVQLADGSALRG